MILNRVEFSDISSPLLQYAKNVTSQCGEDGIIEHIFSVISPEHKLCVEFGAWDGKLYSNSYNLICNKGWRGLMIEADTEKYKQLVTTYAGNSLVRTINRLVDFEGNNTLDNILEEYGVPYSFGLLSIDIDGNDYHIWDSVAKYRPETVVIEFNPSIPNDVLFVQEKSFEINQGNSLLALTLLGKLKGYELAAATSWNAIFVIKEKFELLGITNNSIELMYKPVQNGRIFNGYDGTVHVVGMDRLMWKNINLEFEDFQVLPKSLRTYGGAVAKATE